MTCADDFYSKYTNCLKFNTVFGIICDQNDLLGNDQQVVIHWTTETDLTSSILLKDRDGNHIDSGTSSNGDGCLATLGYFSLGTSSNPFDGDWIPLTFGTRVGDSSSGYGFANGTFGFTTVFTKNSNAVSVYLTNQHLTVLIPKLLSWIILHR